MTIRIAVIDDDQAVREGLALVLEAAARTIVSYDSAEAFLGTLSDGLPDIAFIDLKMPGQSGMELLEVIRALPFHKVMISAHGDVSAAVQALKLGADNFIEKPFDADILEQVILDLGNAPLPSLGGQPLDMLTPREAEVAVALNRGLTNKEVARELDLSPRTVEIHRARIFEKLGVRNLAGLVRVLTLAGVQ